MTFLQDLKTAIKNNQPIAPLLDSCIRPPKATQNPLVDWAISIFGAEKVKQMVIEAIKDNLFNSIKENQNALTLLNSKNGRAYLHKNLDDLLDYLTSDKFAKQYKCPSCYGIIIGKKDICSSCGVGLKWKS